MRPSSSSDFLRPVLLAAVLILPCTGQGEDARLLIQATINGRSARLAYDTGFGFGFVLRSNAAKKFGLRVTPPPDVTPEKGLINLGDTEPCRVTLLGRTLNAVRFGLLEVPPFLPDDFDVNHGLAGSRQGRCDSSSGEKPF